MPDTEHFYAALQKLPYRSSGLDLYRAACVEAGEAVDARPSDLKQVKFPTAGVRFICNQGSQVIDKVKDVVGSGIVYVNSEEKLVERLKEPVRLGWNRRKVAVLMRISGWSTSEILEIIQLGFSLSLSDVVDVAMGVTGNNVKEVFAEVVRLPLSLNPGYMRKESDVAYELLKHVTLDELLEELPYSPTEIGLILKWIDILPLLPSVVARSWRGEDRDLAKVFASGGVSRDRLIQALQANGWSEERIAAAMKAGLRSRRKQAAME